MAALTADRLTKEIGGTGYSIPVAASTKIYAGSLVVRDTSGNAEPGTTATGKIAMGMALEQVDNSAGAAAALNIEVRAGTFRWENSSGDPVTKANVGDTVYIEDDQTVCATATGKSAAGIMTDIDTDGVWVETKPPVSLVSGLTAANNLSDVGTVATAATNLGLGTASAVQHASLQIGAAAIYKVAKTSITAAQLKALATTPISVVAAVANKMHIPLGFALKLEYGSEVLAEPSAPDDLIFKYVDGSGVACTATVDAGEIIVASADAYAWVPSIQVEGGTLAEHVNVPIVAFNSGTNWTGNASNDTVLEVQAFYIELDVS